VALAALVIVALAAFVAFMPYLLMYVKSRTSGAELSLGDIWRLRASGAEPGHVVDCAVVLAQVGEVVRGQRLAEHVEAGGTLDDVVRGMCLARTADVALTFERACEINLAGHSVLGAVTSVVNARDIYLKDPETGEQRIHAEPGDGVELELWVRMTVRTDLQHMLEGAAPEELARQMAQALVEQVEEASSHEDIMKSPGDLADRVYRLHLDRSASLKVESVNVVDVRPAGESFAGRNG
jgi:uncharacterized protein YqfA (UPF0365 family)